MKLRYTKPALADLAEILAFTASKSATRAGKIYARLHTVIELLTSFPHLGKQTANPTIRRLTVTPYAYMIFYEPTGTEIIIHAIRHSADPRTKPG